MSLVKTPVVELRQNILSLLFCMICVHNAFIKFNTILDNTYSFEMNIRQILCTVLIHIYNVECSECNTQKDPKYSYSRKCILKCLGDLVFSKLIQDYVLFEVLNGLNTRSNTIYGVLKLYPAENYNCSSAKKMAPIIEELKDIFNVYTALFSHKFYDSTHSDKLPDVRYLCRMFHQFWPYSLANKDLLRCCIACLINFVSNCLEACDIMAKPLDPTYSHGTVSFTSLNLTSSMLVRVAEFYNSQTTVSPNNSENLKLILRLMQQCSNSIKCRLQIHKSGLLASFRMRPKLQLPSYTESWLLFLQTYTRYVDGQVNVSKTKSCFETIIIFASRKEAPRKINMLALDVLRNLTFNNDAKHIIAAADGFMTLLSTTLCSGTVESKLAILICVLNLITNNSKNKTMLKLSITSQIKDLHDALVLKHEKSENDFRLLEITIKILNVSKSK